MMREYVICETGFNQSSFGIFCKYRMQGYLEIWQGFVSRWTQYFFQIHQDMLIYGPEKNKIEGKIHLKVAQIISAVEDPTTLIIHTGTETLYVRAYSIAERVSWFRKLQSLQKKLKMSGYQSQLMRFEKVCGERQTWFRALTQLNIELWKCHAQLEKSIQETMPKIRSNSGLSSSFDKIRASAEQFKVKSAEMLKILQDVIKQERKNHENRLNSPPFAYSKYSSKDEFSCNDLNESLYVSFSNEPKTPVNDLKSRKVRNIFDDSASLSSNSKDSNLRIPLKIFVNSEVESIFAGNLTNELTRNKLPAELAPEDRLPVLSLLAGALGSQISKVSFPDQVSASEPLSILQKGCQHMYYSGLLKKADSQQSHILRMGYICAFIVSMQSINEKRIRKAFDPLLGETFQFIDEEREFEYISQQVSLHPTVSVFHCRSDRYQVLGNCASTISFSGNSLKSIPQTKMLVTLRKLGDRYYFNLPIITTHNILIGSTYVEHSGEVNVSCPKTSITATIRFKEGTFFSRTERDSFEGEIKFQDNVQMTIEGRWSAEINVLDLKTGERKRLWQKRHTNNERYYNFNDYSFQLNHINKRMLQLIAPTDSRFRPDQRMLEFQKVDLAAQEKMRLEETQRVREASNVAVQKKHQPLWFQVTSIQGESIYTPNDLYWQERFKTKGAKWGQCLQIF